MPPLTHPRLTDAHLRAVYRELPSEVRAAIVELRRVLDALPPERARQALDVVDRMLGHVWRHAEPPAGGRDAAG